jgi:hypothetical protein
MNTVGKNKVSWIPYYLDLVLRSFSNIESLNLNTRSFLLTIADMLNQFRTGKKDSGEDWESLFIVVLLVRLLSNTMNIFFTLNRDESYSVSFNTYFNSRDKSFESFTKVDDFAANIRPPPNFPHVSVYYPTHAKFEELDIILAVWKNVNKKLLYGFQLKKGKNLPEKTLAANTEFEKCYVIRGAAAKVGESIREWNITSNNDIAEFFGVSGERWTPKYWEEISK